ncbi:Putative sodium-dependent multivitamin transporter, partial [Gryllus bimaculatus]
TRRTTGRSPDDTTDDSSDVVVVVSSGGSVTARELSSAAAAAAPSRIPPVDGTLNCTGGSSQHGSLFSCGKGDERPRQHVEAHGSPKGGNLAAFKNHEMISRGGPRFFAKPHPPAKLPVMEEATAPSVHELNQALQLFGIADYAVFAFMLLLCAAIGVYFGFFAGARSADDYLMGGRSMGVVPISMSLIASFISGITLLGTPTEIYLHGTQYTFIAIGVLLMAFVLAYAYLPVFHNLQLTSTYEYLERRFGKEARLIGSVLFAIGIGGLKAVVWTDVVQTVAMFGSMLLVIAKGTADVGGLGVVWSRNWESGRIESPRSVWIFVLGALFLVFTCCYSGLLIYATYHDCDPLTTKKPLTDRQTNVLMKTVVVVTGVVCVSLVFVVEKLGSILQLSMSLGAMTNGPALGIFTMGLFLPWVNNKGMLAGSCAGLLVMGWIVLGAQAAIATGDMAFPTKPFSVQGCTYSFAAHAVNATLAPAHAHADARSDVFPLYRVSYLWYTLLGVVVSTAVALPVSFLTGANRPQDVDARLLSPVVRRFFRPRSAPAAAPVPAANGYKSVELHIIPNSQSAEEKEKEAIWLFETSEKMNEQEEEQFSLSTKEKWELSLIIRYMYANKEELKTK